MFDLETLAAYIKNYRAEHNLSQEDFAYNCGIGKDTIGRIERKVYNPSLSLLQAIAAYCDVSVARLLTPSAEL